MNQQAPKVLPRSAWERVTIRENGELLVLVRDGERIKTGLITKSYPPLFYVRKAVSEMLSVASRFLPEGYPLVLIEGYRTLESQQKSWNTEWKAIRASHPDWNEARVEKAVLLVCAKPSLLANHYSGGAVDVTLVRDGGAPVDMGSPYISEGNVSVFLKKFPMFPNSLLRRRITREQECNRKILRESMEAAGFVWYPGEWWHYCYGDRMWAVYTDRTECFYGPVDLPSSSKERAPA